MLKIKEKFQHTQIQNNSLKDANFTYDYIKKLPAEKRVTMVFESCSASKQ